MDGDKHREEHFSGDPRRVLAKRRAVAEVSDGDGHRGRARGIAARGSAHRVGPEVSRRRAAGSRDRALEQPGGGGWAASRGFQIVAVSVARLERELAGKSGPCGEQAAADGHRRRRKRCADVHFHLGLQGKNYESIHKWMPYLDEKICRVYLVRRAGDALSAEGDGEGVGALLDGPHADCVETVVVVRH